MGNINSEPKKKQLTLQDLTTKIGEYRTINEGDPEMIEDPEFPLKMMYEAMNNNNTIEGNSVQGTYIYYPNKRKAKMWIGNYKILNPEDILCKNVAEKIGMTEIEWKNYIERKRVVQEKPGRKDFFIADQPSEEQSRALREIMKNSVIDYSYDKNEDPIHYNDSEYIMNSPHFYNHNEIKIDHDYECYFHNSGEIKNNYSLDEKIYYDQVSIKEDKTYEDIYINKLNDEITKIREDQERMINEERKDIYAYSKSSPNQIIIPQKNGSFLVENVNSMRSGNKNMIKELINDKKNKNILQSKNKKGYKNLSSMSTKGSLGITHSNIDEHVTKKNAYLNRTLVK